MQRQGKKVNHEFVEFLLSGFRESAGHFHHLQLPAVAGHPTPQLINSVHEIPHLQRMSFKKI